eukprot:GHVP01024174.1.p1 GENE.GHVP01024174.1~~GHVP01024174.1.p1  ORF type:complete len:120 (+),score=24.42 GHVP01024174.1:883-1242(+)
MAVRTKTVKRAAKQIIEAYYTRLTYDFQVNKRICDVVATIPSVRLRNQIAGYITRLMKRIDKGPVRGISLQLQEEEREKKENYIPHKSALERETLVDPVTMGMLESLGMGSIPYVSIKQ